MLGPKWTNQKRQLDLQDEQEGTKDPEGSNNNDEDDKDE